MRLSLLAPLALPILVPLSDSPELVHTADTSLTRSWTVGSTRSIDSATLNLMGNEQDIGTGSTRTSTLTLEVTDDFKKVADGRATSIHRIYDTIQTEIENEGLEETENMRISDGSGASELEGLGVLFDHDDEWSSAFDEDSPGDDDWLEGLVVGMDLENLLPKGDDGEPVEVEVGDAWDLDAAFLSDVLSPGGVVQIAPEDDTDMPEGGIAISLPSSGDSNHWAQLEGELVATYEKIVETDGNRLARIVIAVEMEGEVDLSDELEEAASERGMEETYTEALLELALEGEVVVLWNLEAKRPESVEGKLSGTETLSTEWAIAHEVMELEIAYNSESTVEYVIEATYSN